MIIILYRPENASVVHDNGRVEGAHSSSSFLDPVARSEGTLIASENHIGRGSLLDKHNSGSTTLSKSSSKDGPPKNILTTQYGQSANAVTFKRREEDLNVSSYISTMPMASKARKDLSCDKSTNMIAAPEQTSASYINDDEYYLDLRYYGKGKQRAIYALSDESSDYSIGRTFDHLPSVPVTTPHIESQSSASSLYSERSLMGPAFESREIVSSSVNQNATTRHSSTHYTETTVEAAPVSMRGISSSYINTSQTPAEPHFIHPLHEQEHEVVQSLRTVYLSDQSSLWQNNESSLNNIRPEQVPRPRDISGIVKSPLENTELGLDELLTL